MSGVLGPQGMSLRCNREFQAPAAAVAEPGAARSAVEEAVPAAAANTAEAVALVAAEAVVEAAVAEAEAAAAEYEAAAAEAAAAVLAAVAEAPPGQDGRRRSADGVGWAGLAATAAGALVPTAGLPWTAGDTAWPPAAGGLDRGWTMPRGQMGRWVRPEPRGPAAPC